MAGVLVAMLLAAPGSGRVAAHAERCPPGFEPELRRLLTIELKAPVVEAVTAGDSAVHVRCVGDRYRVTLLAPLHNPLELEVDTSELDPLAIPRAVTLVVAEALTSLWRSPEDQAPAVVEPVAEVPIVVAPPVVGEPRVEVALFGGGRIAALPLFGGGVALDVAVLPWLGVRVDFSASRGSANRVSGQVLASLFDGSAALDVRLSRAHWLLRLGAGLRAGYALLDGLPGNESVVAGSVGGVLWGPQVSAGAAWRPLRWLSFGIGADGGVWAPRLEGEVVGEAPVRIDGLFASLWGSAGIRW